MTRLEDWIDAEVSEMQKLYALTDAEEVAFRDALRGTVHGQQLALADAAGDLGDAVLADLKAVSDAARDRSLREWFRRHW